MQTVKTKNSHFQIDLDALVEVIDVVVAEMKWEGKRAFEDGAA